MRTEDQIIAQDPIKAKLGGTEYEIPLLKLSKSRLWKQEWYDAVFKSDKWKETVGKVEAAQKGDASKLQEELSMGFHLLLIDQPETVVNLVLSYLKYADVKIEKEWIDENATEAEIALLWEQINDVSFPLVTSLANAMNLRK